MGYKNIFNIIVVYMFTPKGHPIGLSEDSS